MGAATSQVLAATPLRAGSLRTGQLATRRLQLVALTSSRGYHEPTAMSSKDRANLRNFMTSSNSEIRKPSTSFKMPDDFRISFVGAGRMAQALSNGFISAGLVKPSHTVVADINDEMLEFFRHTGVRMSKHNVEAVEESDAVVLAVKPSVLPSVLQQIPQHLVKEKLFISIAAGVTIETMQSILGEEARVVRVMPNTPALVQCGASIFSPGPKATPEDGALVSALFTSIGICETLPESYLDAVTGLSGGGPAYAFMAIESLADGGVKMGLPRNIAQRIAAQTLMGSCKLLIESGLHPGELKDAVCSPGGTTIAGVHVLETTNFRSSLVGAVEAATNRSRQLQSETS